MNTFHSTPVPYAERGSYCRAHTVVHVMDDGGLVSAGKPRRIIQATTSSPGVARALRGRLSTAS